MTTVNKRADRMLKTFVFIDDYLTDGAAAFGRVNSEGCYELPDGDSWEPSEVGWLGSVVEFLSRDELHEAIREWIQQKEKKRGGD